MRVLSALTFVDYDCRYTPQKVLPWDHWRSTAIFKGVDTSLEYAQKAAVEYREDAHECPLGLLFSDILYAIMCFTRNDLECYQRADEYVREGVRKTSFRILMATEWPILDALNSIQWRHELSDSPHDNCHNYTSVNWPAFQQVFKLDNWYQEAVNVAYGSELEESWRHQHLECPLGFTLANLVKAMLCANTESVCFPGHAAFIFQVLEKFPLHYTGGTNWPVFAMTKHVAKVVTRHGFSLDFLSDELRGEWTPPFSLAMQGFLSVLVRLKLTNQDNLVVMTMVYGTQFVPYIKRFMQRAHVLGVENLIVFTLDDEAYARCVKAQGLCIRGKPTILHKFTLPLMFLHAHYDVLWIDFDVFLFKNPIPHVLARAHETNSSILTSGAFGADCVNSGIVFFSSTNEVKVWVFHVLHWLYEHPYEHDQKTVSAFLRAGERVAFEEALPVQAPRWDYLDPAVQFVSARHVPVAGWTGDMRDIVIFHFLNGDSDASVGSHQFAQRVGLGDYRMLMDAFYNRTEEDLYSTTKPPWEVAPALRELLMLSWQESRPTDRKRCNSTVPMRY